MNDEIKILPDGRMTARSASMYLGIAYRTLANHRTNGTGPKFIKRGVVYYFKEDLDEWLTAAKCRSAAEARLKAHLAA
jgi:hypothetical protein